MPEKSETLYQRIKSDLVARQDMHGLRLAGEMLTYGGRYFLQEYVEFFLSPLPDIEFDPQQLEEFTGSLVLEEPRPNHFFFLPGWRKLYLYPSGEMEELVFPALSYQEKLTKEEDLLSSFVYQTLRQQELVPEFNRFHSCRKISMYVYPSWAYAQTIFDYKEGRQVRSLGQNPVMDYLSHYITQEQLAILRANSDRSFESFPPPPRLASSFEGKGN